MTIPYDQEHVGLGPANSQTSKLNIDHLNTYSNPLDMIISTLSRSERQMIETGKFHILASRIREIKAIYAAHLMKEISDELTDLYTEMLIRLELFEQKIRGLKYQEYAEVFAHRRLSIWTKNVERLEDALTGDLILEVERDVYPKETKKGFWQRLMDKIFS